MCPLDALCYGEEGQIDIGANWSKVLQKVNWAKRLKEMRKMEMKMKKKEKRNNKLVTLEFSLSLSF